MFPTMALVRSVSVLLSLLLKTGDMAETDLG